MNKLIYDGSFEGLLTALFEVIEYNYDSAEIVEAYNDLEDLFSEKHIVVTQPDKAKRILDFFQKKIPKAGPSTILKLYLSEHLDKNRLLLELLRKCITSTQPHQINNLADPTILEISKILRSMSRETHRMKAFVRFRRLSNDYYYAEIDPDFNVLPLIKPFFTKRYANQLWMIHDVRRNYALNYDKKEAVFLYLDETETNELSRISNDIHISEQNYQKLWKRYFEKINIKERKNLKLHHQQLPKRYWKYLTEKSG